MTGQLPRAGNALHLGLDVEETVTQKSGKRGDGRGSFMVVMYTAESGN